MPIKDPSKYKGMKKAPSKRKNSKFTMKQESFIYHRARNHTLKDSIFKAGYKFRTDDEAMSYGSTLESQLRIKEAINKEKLKVFDKNNITEEWIIEKLVKFTDEKTIGIKPTDRLKALELLGKWRALYTDKVKGEGFNNIQVNVIGMKDNDIRKRISEKVGEARLISAKVEQDNPPN